MDDRSISQALEALLEPNVFYVCAASEILHVSVVCHLVSATYFCVAFLKHVLIGFMVSSRCWFSVFLMYGYFSIVKNRSVLFCILCSISIRDVNAWCVGWRE